MLVVYKKFGYLPSHFFCGFRAESLNILKTLFGIKERMLQTYYKHVSPPISIRLAE